MTTTLDRLQEWLNAPSENAHLEFKEAKQRYDFEELVKYCCALANERGGRMILGVTDKRPRQVVGSFAFEALERTKAGLIERLHLRIDAEEILHPDGRVLVFHVPSRPLGMPIQYKGAYWMRKGGSLAPMTPDMLKRIFEETEPDFSNKICKDATLDDLDSAGIEEFRRRWQTKSGNQRLAVLAPEQLLKDAELIRNDGITYAALILMGKRESLGVHLGNAEVIFEYRSSETSIVYQQRKEFREGLFLFFDELWNLINLRNDIQHYQDGLFVWDIPTFNEDVIRETMLNAVSHRDYRLAGSVFVRQFPKKMEIVSPGGFPEGITTENLLYQQAPRNRKISEVLAKCGLVERSGQGFDKIYTACVKETKPLPDFSKTDVYYVFLTLHGIVQDHAFLQYLEKIGQETQKSFYVDDFLTLEYLRTGKSLPENLKQRVFRLRESGIIELVGRGRGSRYILSKNLYNFAGRKGTYTRKRGLDRETNKQLLIKHLQHHKKGKIQEFEEIFRSFPLTRAQIHSLLLELKKDGIVRFIGSKKSGYWELTLV
jgi:ATP-dependent DNA helicase RecG